MSSQKPSICLSHAIAALVAACFLLFAAPGMTFAQKAATVDKVVGEAFVEREGSREQLKSGAVINITDLIETSKGAKVRIVFADGSAVVAGPDTRFAVSDYDPADRQGGVLTLLSGIIRTGVSALWDSGFSVETRAAVASVRSTHWVTIADADRTSVFVLTGEVSVRSSATGDEAVLRSGDGIDVPVDGEMGPIKQWPMERVGTTMAPTMMP